MTKIKKSKDKIETWIIDDNKQFCLILSKALNNSASVKCSNYYHSVKSAILALEEEENPPSVVLLDIKMPTMNGLEGIPVIKRHSPGSDILMLTSYDDDNEIRQAFFQGAKGYILKTSSSDDIIRAIEKIVEGGSPIDPSIGKRLMDAYAAGEKHKTEHHLSAREIEIISLFAQDSSIEEVAKKLCLSVHTVNSHRKNIYHKLKVHTRSGLTNIAIKEGLIN